MTNKCREKEKDFYRQIELHKRPQTEQNIDDYLTLTLSQSDSADSDLNLGVNL